MYSLYPLAFERFRLPKSATCEFSFTLFDRNEDEPDNRSVLTKQKMTTLFGALFLVPSPCESGQCCPKDIVQLPIGTLGRFCRPWVQERNDHLPMNQLREGLCL